MLQLELGESSFVLVEYSDEYVIEYSSTQQVSKHISGAKEQESLQPCKLQLLNVGGTVPELICIVPGHWPGKKICPVV